MVKLWGVIYATRPITEEKPCNGVKEVIAGFVDRELSALQVQVVQNELLFSIRPGQSDDLHTEIENVVHQNDYFYHSRKIRSDQGQNLSFLSIS